MICRAVSDFKGRTETSDDRFEHLHDVRGLSDGRDLSYVCTILPEIRGNILVLCECRRPSHAQWSSSGLEE